MVIHDLKHPTESMISQLGALHQSLADQVAVIDRMSLALVLNREKLRQVIGKSYGEESLHAPKLVTQNLSSRFQSGLLEDQGPREREIIDFDNSLLSNVSNGSKI